MQCPCITFCRHLRVHPPPDLLASNDDTLNEVFRNFEDVLRSHERGLGNGHIEDGHETESELQKVDLLRNAPKYADSPTVSPGAETTQTSPSHWRDADQRKASEILDMVFGPARSRSGSTSSISSLSTNSSSAVHDFPGLRAAMAAQRHHLVGVSRSAAGHREQAAASPVGGSNPLGVNRAALANVRDLMATSLGRIRHLEDEVKAIPLLQEKLSLLEEEKRLLMLQLKTKSNQLGQRSVGVGDNHILGPTKKDSGGDALDEYIRKLEKQGLAASPKTSFSDAKVQASVPTTSTHSMTLVTMESCFQTQSMKAVRKFFHHKEADTDWKHIPRAKLHVCARCTERAKKQFESKETATDPEAGKDVHKKLEQLTFDVCEPTSVKPDPRPCPHCEERSKRVFGHSSTNTEAVLTSSVGVSVLTLQPYESPPPESPQRPRRSRSQGAQTQRVLKGNVGVQFSPGPIRKRDVMLQADVTERRHVGLQVTTVEAKPLTVSTGTGYHGCEKGCLRPLREPPSAVCCGRKPRQS
ncbi:hypothetical protein MTO96_027115 [Rhipicephalus appendiculatus]